MSVTYSTHPQHAIQFGIVGLVSMLGGDNAAATIRDQRQSADDETFEEQWSKFPDKAEHSRLTQSRQTIYGREQELDALIELHESKLKEATHAGSYADAKSANSRLAELREEQEFCSERRAVVSSEEDKCKRRIERSYYEQDSSFRLAVQRRCESEIAEKMTRLLELIRPQTDLVQLLVEIASYSAV